MPKGGSSPYIPLEAVFARTFKTVPWEQVGKILARGRVPMVGTRNDLFGHPPDRIEGLLAKACETFFLTDCILAHYSRIYPYGPRFDITPQDRLALFGQHSDLTKWPTTNPATIKFCSIGVHWPKLIEALEEAGFTVSAEPARSQQRVAYKGELTSFMKRHWSMGLVDLSDDDIVRRFEDHVAARIKAGRSTLKLPQRRHIANQVVKIRAGLSENTAPSGD